MAVILPPKIYYYEPKIFGFKIAGKRGSKFFDPPKGNVRYVEDSVQGLELEEKLNQAAQGKISLALVTKDFNKKLNFTEPKKEQGAAAKAAAATSTGGEDNEATSAKASDANRGGRKNRKKNKK